MALYVNRGTNNNTSENSEDDQQTGHPRYLKAPTGKQDISLMSQETECVVKSRAMSTPSAVPLVITPTEYKQLPSDTTIPIDVSWFMPTVNRKGSEEFHTKRIPNARYLGTFPQTLISTRPTLTCALVRRRQGRKYPRAESATYDAWSGRLCCCVWLADPPIHLLLTSLHWSFTEAMGVKSDSHVVL